MAEQQRQDKIDGSPSPLIEGRHIEKRFKNNGIVIEVLKDVNFRFMAGQTIAVVGPSGIGKSTFLHILGTLDCPDKGALYFKGQDLMQLDDTVRARHRNANVGFVFQFHHLMPEFTAEENAMMPALIKGMDKKSAQQSAETLLVRVGLKDRMHHRVTELSGGEQQRVALARALVLNPPLLLADEPTGNLDKKNSELVHHLLIELNRELFMTMVVVTHNPDLADIMSSRVTIVDGQLVDI